MNADCSVRAAGVVVAVLLVCYLGTLAPTVTLWDAGEFASAVATFGIPHPPGTPLYVLVARAFALAFSWLPVARATSLFSALCTIAASAILGALVARWTRRALEGAAAGSLAGLVSSVWLNANETEVYAASLLLSALMLLAAEGARRRDAGRHSVVIAYAFALAVPLHLSALVAAPAAITLAAVPPEGRVRISRGIALGGAMLIAAGAGVVSPWPVAAGLVLLPASVIVPDARSRASRSLVGLAMVGAVALALTPLVVMLIRAPLEPGIDQGFPTTFGALLDVVARRQYAVPGLWARRAPFWLQVGNLIQYADWQMGLALARDAVGATWARTPVTIVFVALGVLGARAQWRADRRSWWGMLALVGAATLGVVVYLNLQAGPSIGHGILPPDAEHEARERDYFFALGFAAFAAWAGVGLAALARGLAGGRAWMVVATGIGLAAAGNWRAVDRARGANARLAERFARALLEGAPQRTVLFVAGDNDTYPVWYEQWGERVRPDVTPITIPLLPADWYRAELARRFALGDEATTPRWRGQDATLRAIAERAHALGRPVAATVAVERDERAAIGGSWILAGMVYVQRPDGPADRPPAVDTAASRASMELIERMRPGPYSPADYPDPTARYVASLLDCPRLALRVVPGTDPASRALLDSRCNFR